MAESGLEEELAFKVWVRWAMVVVGSAVRRAVSERERVVGSASIVLWNKPSILERRLRPRGAACESDWNVQRRLCAKISGAWGRW